MSLCANSRKQRSLAVKCSAVLCAAPPAPEPCAISAALLDDIARPENPAHTDCSHVISALLTRLTQCSGNLIGYQKFVSTSRNAPQAAESGNPIGYRRIARIVGVELAGRVAWGRFVIDAERVFIDRRSMFFGGADISPWHVPSEVFSSGFNVLVQTRSSRPRRW